MKLQLALDVLDLNESIKLLEKIHDLIDIVEIGTPWIVKEGVKNIKEIKERFSDVEVLADIKIMDGGKMETEYALDMGASIVTVMSVTNDVTIQNVINETHAKGAKTLVDMMNCIDIAARSKQLVDMGADYICVHTATDTLKTAEASLEELRKVCEVIDCKKVAIAGGVNLNNIDMVVKYKPEIIIVGSAIIKAQDQRAITQELINRMK